MRNRVSIDKCSGESCPCHLKPIRIITNAKIHSVNFISGPSIFPGAGGMSIQMIDTTPRTPPGPQVDAMIMSVEAYRRLKERR